MKTVILAAGMGSRIQSVTNGKPKCLLSFGRYTILDFQLESLWSAGIDDIAVVVGHQADQIIGHVARKYGDQLRKITFIENPIFASTNNMYSLWLTREWLGGSRLLVLNADVLCHPHLLLPAVHNAKEVLVMVDPEFREETTKVIIRDGRVLALSKTISREECSGTFANILAFSETGGRALFDRAESLFAQKELNGFVNDVVGYLIREGTRVSYTETRGLPWAEIDDAGDLAFAKANVFPFLGAPGVQLPTVSPMSVLSPERTFQISRDPGYSNRSVSSALAV
jgi:choline kinase